MKKKLLFTIRQLFKMLLQNILLPCVYRFWCLLYRKKEKDLIILADSHHDEIPFSMLYMYHTLQKKGYPVVTDICDYRNLSFVQSALPLIRATTFRHLKQHRISSPHISQFIDLT